MEFKREYSSPEIQVITPITSFSVLGEISDGVLEEYEAKKGDFEEEEKTGIPTKFSNIWGDEEDED